MPLRVKIDVQVRWADFDMLGHVNNAKFLTYLEVSRDVLLKHCLVEGFNDCVMVRVELDFRHEIPFGVGSVGAHTELVEIGTSSLRTADRLVLPDGTVAAEAATVIVVRDPAGRRSRPLSAAERSRLDAALAGDEVIQG